MSIMPEVLTVRIERLSNVFLDKIRNDKVKPMLKQITVAKYKVKMIREVV